MAAKSLVLFTPYPDHESMRDNSELLLNKCLLVSIVFSLPHTQQVVFTTTRDRFISRILGSVLPPPICYISKRKSA
jgi:hypothetical protein